MGDTCYQTIGKQLLDSNQQSPKDVSTLLLRYDSDARKSLSIQGTDPNQNIDLVIKIVSQKIISNIDYFADSNTTDLENSFISCVLNKFPPEPKMRQQYYTQPSGGFSSSMDTVTPSSEETTSKNCKQPVNPNQLKVTFEQIAGQEETKADIQKTYIFPIQYPNLFVTKSKGMLLYGPGGTGKCHSPEEKILLFDGTIKEARHIRQGDLLMGDDSTPRKVLETCTGIDDMFEIIPSSGESYKVNAPHILCLRSSEDGSILEIPLNEYIEKSDGWKKNYTGYRVSVEWKSQDTFCSFYDCGKNIENIPKIPASYRVNSKQNRLELVRGILENNSVYEQSNNSYKISNKPKSLIDDIVFIFRSLGHFNIKITELDSGRYDCIIYDFDYTCKDISYYDFSVKFNGKGVYCGFVLDGNHRYLLKDFTVTHNTLLVKAAVKELGGSTAFFNPSPGEIKGSKHGQTEKNIDLLFKCAEDIIGTTSGKSRSGETIKYNSAVIFIDEFDGIGGLKKDDPMMILSVNALLQRMDGILSDESKSVSVIAATNYPWNIEDALLRRFTNRVFVDLPDVEARKYLILEPLHRYFIPPGFDRPPLYKDGILHYDFLEIVETVGSKGLCDEYRGRIDKNYIDLLAERLGASDEAETLKDEIMESGKARNVQDIHDIDEYKFGFSGSDISKIMDIAIQNAAFRALSVGFFKKVIIKEPKGYYYVAIAESEAEEKDVYVIDENKGDYKIIDVNDRDKLFNFSICVNDIEEAILKYPSTINPRNYVELLNYKYAGVSPK